MTIPRFKIGDVVCLWCRSEGAKEAELYVMTIMKMYLRKNSWFYDLEGEIYELEEVPEHRIMGKCIL